MIDEVATDLNLMNEFVDSGTKKLTNSIDQDVLAYWATKADATNQGNTAGAISGDLDLGAPGTPRTITTGANGNAVDLIIDLSQALMENNVDGPYKCVIPAWMVSALKTGDIRRADITNDPKGTIRSGILGEVNGVTLFASNNLPWDNTAKESTILFCSKEANTFAMQLTKSETLRIPDSFGQYFRSLVVYGRETVQPKALAVGVIKKG